MGVTICSSTGGNEPEIPGSSTVVVEHGRMQVGGFILSGVFRLSRIGVKPRVAARGGAVPRAGEVDWDRGGDQNLHLKSPFLYAASS